MPSWPELKRYFYGSVDGTPTSSVSAVEYHRARADAAMARLRVAVEALGGIQAVAENIGTAGDWAKFAAKEALQAIGDLPKE